MWCGASFCVAISLWLWIITVGCTSLILCALPLVVLAVFPPIRKGVLPHPVSDTGIGPLEGSWAASSSQFRFIGPVSCYCYLRTLPLDILCPPSNKKQNQIFFCTYCIFFLKTHEGHKSHPFVLMIMLLVLLATNTGILGRGWVSRDGVQIDCPCPIILWMAV